jgi:hypothetical protein
MQGSEIIANGKIKATWLVVPRSLLRERVDAFSTVLPNLRRHAAGYPDAAQLAGVIRSGSPMCGMQGVGQGKDTEASRLITEVIDRADARPVYIPVWAADLARARGANSRASGAIRCKVARVFFGSGRRRSLGATELSGVVLADRLAAAARALELLRFE